MDPEFQIRDKRILLISPEGWGPHRVSKHHYAITLARQGNEVYFLNPPNTDAMDSQIPGLIIINHSLLFRGLSYLPKLISSFLTLLEIKWIETKLGLRFDIIWNFDPSRIFNLGMLKRKLRIAHLVDLNQTFSREILCASSDLVLCTSKQLHAILSEFNDNCHNIGHGCQNEIGNKVREELSKIILNDSKIKVGYIGNLSYRYLDWPTIHSLVESFEESNFYFIGPEGVSNLAKSINNPPPITLKSKGNTFFLGPVDSSEINSLLPMFDILLVAYKYEDREQMANPHKIMEYFNSGKVILSSYTSEYSEQKDLLVMVDRPEDMVESFRAILNGIDEYNSMENKQKRRKFSLSHSYENQINRIEKILKK